MMSTLNTKYYELLYFEVVYSDANFRNFTLTVHEFIFLQNLSAFCQK